ncbi:trifunctional nucleotide phosphoesterase protein YfkN-like protein [Dinothrombium tinctorium]|uniref:Trifunctional nucleotide phosphoesterase protein YfkN-like protein n=1 Tax=Dinothrombium tinctorium TaxID=1965070 RepID=A0A3S3RHU2_9ACAR|nr:trifunctional nucleotide phosphoesterase protein YfkN-like protein [Dinothrombium tinctorium]
MSESKTVTILHFNDCYNIESGTREPCGGAARFKTAIDSLRDDNTMVLFSGDLFSPSYMSTFTKGEHMIHVMNALGVDCSVYGNHDFDFGVQNLISLANQCAFPWLMSNVIDNETNKTLAQGKVSHILECNGKKFGFIGLVEEEWLATIATIDKDDITYYDFVIEGKKLAKHLKEKENVDFVIALTHMRFPNDCRLAENVDEIDLILGGHDHVYEVKKVNEKFIVKSGTDFRQLSKITINLFGNKFDINVQEVNITFKEFEENESLKELLSKYSVLIEEKMDIVLGHLNCDLEGRFSKVRTQETNLGNFVADIILACTHSDLAILNSGTLRSDRIHPKGIFKMRDLYSILPALSPLAIISATGEQIWKALENGVSQWPKLEGRFPLVSGVQFAFDPKKPAGSRIDPKFIKIGGEYLEMNQKYRLVTKEFLRKGKDGYEVFTDCEILLSEEECPNVRTSVQNHLEAIKTFTDPALFHTRHRQSFVALSRRHNKVKHEMTHAIANSLTTTKSNACPSYQECKKSTSLDTQKSVTNNSQTSIDDIEYEQFKLEPKIDGRIVIVTVEAKQI